MAECSSNMGLGCRYFVWCYTTGFIYKLDGFLMENNMEHINREISFEEAKEKAEKGDADSQCFLGMVYAAGLKVPKDFDESIKWYRKAVDQGHSTAEYYLGHLLEEIGEQDGN